MRELTNAQIRWIEERMEEREQELQEKVELWAADLFDDYQSKHEEGSYDPDEVKAEILIDMREKLTKQAVNALVYIAAMSTMVRTTQEINTAMKIMKGCDDLKKFLDDYYSTEGLDFMRRIFTVHSNNLKSLAFCIEKILESRPELTEENEEGVQFLLKRCDQYTEEYDSIMVQEMDAVAREYLGKGIED